MGMFTELILGCSLKEETPQIVINTLKYILLEEEEQEKYNQEIDKTILVSRIHWMFKSSGSYYFGASSGLHDLTYDCISKEWRITARFNIKNYENEIEAFLAWLKPWIRQGSGSKEMYAIVTYEEGEPCLYNLIED